MKMIPIYTKIKVFIQGNNCGINDFNKLNGTLNQEKHF